MCRVAGASLHDLTRPGRTPLAGPLFWVRHPKSSDRRPPPPVGGVAWRPWHQAMSDRHCADGTSLLPRPPRRRTGKGGCLPCGIWAIGGDRIQRSVVRLSGRSGGPERADRPGGGDDRSNDRRRAPAAHLRGSTGHGWPPVVRPTPPPASSLGSAVITFGECRCSVQGVGSGKIDIASRVQDPYQPKHPRRSLSRSPIGPLASLACRGPPYLLVRASRKGVGLRITSRRRAYRNLLWP